jgi:hypothetical protein
MGKQTEPQIIIKEHRPWRGWFFGILLVIGGGMAGWLLSPQSIALLERAAEKNQAPPPKPISSLPEPHPKLEQENIRLQEHAIRIQQELKIEQQTRADLSANLIALQDEILELKRQLATYKRLVKSLQEQEQGLHIEELTFSKTATERLFRYRLVLTQGHNRDQFNQGKIEVAIRGIMGGEAAKLNLDTLSKGNPLTFKFKYFQILEGELLLPAHFKPTQVEVALLPQEDSARPVVQTFAWASLEGER